METDRISQLERLQRLREAGALTDAEFAREKSQVLGYAPEGGERAGRRRAPMVLGLLVLAVIGGLVLAATIMPAMKMAQTTIVHRHPIAVVTTAGSPDFAGGDTADAAADDQTSEADPASIVSHATPVVGLLTRWGQLEAECRSGQRSPTGATCRARDEMASALHKARGALDL